MINENETSERIPKANRGGEHRVYAADNVENVAENVKDDDEVDQLVENAKVCDGNDVECDKGGDNVIENVEDCVENDLEAGEEGFTVGDNRRVVSNQRPVEIVEGSINDQTAHVQQENVVSNILKSYKTPKPNMSIKFRLIGQSECTKARVLSKQTKRTGKNKRLVQHFSRWR